MKVYWTVRYGQFRTSEYTFQGKNAKRDAQRLVKRLGGLLVCVKGPRLTMRIDGANRSP
jgi:hypothetical protein